MPLLLFAGCGLVAFGVPAALCCTVVGRRAQLAIIAIAAAFAFIVVLMAQAGVWAALPFVRASPVAQLVVGVALQEAARALLFVGYTRCEAKLWALGVRPAEFPLADVYSALAAGLGWGATHTLLLYGSLLAGSFDHGVMYSPACSYMSTFVLSAWFAFAANLNHISLMLLGFDAFRRSPTLAAPAGGGDNDHAPPDADGGAGDPLRAALQAQAGSSYLESSFPLKFSLVVAGHLVASGLSLLNGVPDACVIGLPLVLCATAALASYACWVVTRPSYHSKRD